MCLQNDFELSNEFIKRSFHHELFFGSFRHQKTIHPEWNTAADEEMTPVEEPAEEKQDPTTTTVLDWHLGYFWPKSMMP